MYTLKEWLKLTIGNEPYEGWDGKMFCSENDLAMTQKTNITQGFAACYSFTLVTCGWLRMRYNDRELMIQKDDLYIYSPGLAVTILDGSADYQNISLSTAISDSMPTSFASQATISRALSNECQAAPSVTTSTRC